MRKLVLAVAVVAGLTVGLLYIAASGRSAPPTFAQACVPAPSGLVSWWPGDGNASDIQDSNNGTLQNGATFAAGKVGQTFSFDGVDDHVRIADALNLRVQQHSLDAWVKLDTSSGIQIILGKPFSTGVDNSFVLHIINGQLVTYISTTSGGVALFGPAVPISSFFHVAHTWDGSTLKLYLNGSLVASTAASGTINYDSNTVLIGADSNNGVFEFFLDGLIDEVEIYNRALTASEIQAIFNAGGAGKCKVQDQCGSTLAAAQQQVTTLTQQNQSLTTELAAANQTIASLNGQVAQLQGQVTTLTQQNQTLQNRVDTLTAENNALQGQVTTLMQQNQTLQNRVNTLTAVNNALQGQVITLTTENNALKAPGAQAASVIASVQNLLPTAPKDAKGKLEQALKKLGDAQVFLAAGDLDHGIQQMKAALQELINAADKGVDTTALQKTLVDGVAIRVTLAVEDVEALVGGDNKKVLEAKALLQEGQTLLLQGKFKEALDAFRNALQKASGAR